MTEYLYESLAGKPHLGFLESRIGTALPSALFQEMSYHPDQHWLKVWFSEALSEGDEAILSGLVADSLGGIEFLVDTGSVFFELFQTDNKRWQKQTRRVEFNGFMPAIPTITVSDATFDGAADIEVINVTQRYFDFRVTATKSASQSRGFNTVEFNWRAETWQV